MTFSKWAVDYCYQRGMSKDDAEKAVNAAKANAILADMQDRWEDETDGYPQPLLNVLAVSLKSAVAEWIAENRPFAWYQIVFGDKAKDEAVKS